MANTIVKVVISTVLCGVILLVLHSLIGYERTEFLAFALLIGLAVGSLKSH